MSEKCNAFLRPLKNKGCKEERGARMRLDNFSPSTTLESNKSLLPKTLEDCEVMGLRTRRDLTR